MIRLLLPIHFQLPFYDLMVGSGGMVICQYGPFHYQSGRQCHVDHCLAFVVLPCPVVSGSATIFNFPSIQLDHTFPAASIPLRVPPWVPSTTKGIRVSREDSSVLLKDALPVHLWSLSLSRLRVSLIVNIENPCYLFPSPPDISYNSIIVSSPA